MDVKYYVFLICFIIHLFFFWGEFIRPFRNPYTLTFVFGKKGSGKTTDGVRRAVAALRQGQHVYTDIYLSPDTPGYASYYHRVSHPEQLGVTFFPPAESLLLLDEVGLIWNNRDWKSFNSKTREWFKLQRQYHVTCVLYSQTFDVDVQIRGLTDQMFLASRLLPSLLVMRRINRKLVVVKPSPDAESRIADELELVPLILQLFGAHAVRLCFLPDYVQYYDTDYKSKGL